MDKHIKNTMKALEANGMNVMYVATKAEVPEAVRSLLKPGQTVAVGGSMTLEEAGVMPVLRCGDYIFLDRYVPGLTRPEVEEIFRKSYSADSYLCSSNAITEKGELYNVDGNANRVAALANGPKQVIVVAGINKIVPDLDAAIKRVKTVAAPLNSKRLHCETPCAVTGHCAAAEGGMTEGCRSPQRICCSYLVCGQQRVQGRIKVILVGESCGY